MEMLYVVLIFYILHMNMKIELKMLVNRTNH